MSLYDLERNNDVEGLRHHLQSSDSKAVRRRAAELLGSLGDDSERVVTVLVEAAQRDADQSVRGAAIDALDQLGQSAIESFITEMAGQEQSKAADWVRAEAFVKALGAGQPELRMAAANALGRLDNPKTVPALVQRLDDDDQRVRERSARACGKIGDTRAVPALVSTLDDDAVAVRREAAEALAAIGSDHALAALLDRSDDESEVIRHIVVSALGEFGDPRPLDALIEALEDDVDLIRQTAVFSIIELLSKAPAQQSHALRDRVVGRLNETDNDSVVAPLLEILDESQQTPQRRNATWLLGRVQSETYRQRTVETLIDVLGDDDELSSQFAATSLASIGGADVERALLDVVDDESEPLEARTKAVFVLGKIGGDRSRDRLNRLVNDAEEDEIRKRAFSALSKLGGVR